MSRTTAYEQPLVIEICDGEVVLRTDDGPFAISLTPSAAALTAEHLTEAAQVALGDQASQPAGNLD